MKCENVLRRDDGRAGCSATGLLCRYVASDPLMSGCPCLYDSVFSENSRVRKILESIRAVREGSTVHIIYRTTRGWNRLVTESEKGTVAHLDDYGNMEVQVPGWPGTVLYHPEQFGGTIHLDENETEDAVQGLQEEMEEQERINAERREGNGREEEGTG